MIVRQANSNGGPCELLGPRLEEQMTRLVYRCQTGLKAHIPKRLVHLEPCRSCPDHHRSRFPGLGVQMWVQTEYLQPNTLRLRLVEGPFFLRTVHRSRGGASPRLLRLGRT